VSMFASCSFSADLGPTPGTSVSFATSCSGVLWKFVFFWVVVTDMAHSAHAALLVSAVAQGAQEQGATHRSEGQDDGRDTRRAQSRCPRG